MLPSRWVGVPKTSRSGRSTSGPAASRRPGRRAGGGPPLAWRMRLLARQRSVRCGRLAGRRRDAAATQPVGKGARMRPRLAYRSTQQRIGFMEVLAPIVASLVLTACAVRPERWGPSAIINVSGSRSSSTPQATVEGTPSGRAAGGGGQEAETPGPREAPPSARTGSHTAVRGLASRSCVLPVGSRTPASLASATRGRTAFSRSRRPRATGRPSTRRPRATPAPRCGRTARGRRSPRWWRRGTRRASSCHPRIRPRP